MKKTVIVTMLASATAFLMLTGCGNSAAASSAPQVTDSAQTAQTEASAPATDTEQAADAAPASTETPAGGADASSDDSTDKYAGDWYEEIAGRGTMEITSSGDGKYDVEVTWGDSAAETDEWHITATLDSSSGDLTYDDGSWQQVLYDDNGNGTVEDQKTVKGVLHLTDDGKLEWTDNAYDTSDPSVFVRQ